MRKLNFDSVQLYDVAVYKNDKCPDGIIVLRWDSDFGFGEYTLKLDHNLHYEDKMIDDYEFEINGDSEYMDNKKEKKFLRILLSKLADKTHIES